MNVEVTMFGMWAYNRVSEQRLDEEQHQQAAGEVRNSRQASRQQQTQCATAHTDENVDTVQSLFLSQKDKPESHRTEKFRVKQGIHRSSILRIIHKDVQCASQVQ